jgi:hypothetical protein
MQLWTSLIRALAPSVAVAAMALAGTASAVQHTPTATALLHTVSDGQPGAEWNTSGVGSGGSISYSSGTQTLSITGVLDVLNWYDPAGPASCDMPGENCSFNYAPDLDITLTAVLDSITVTSIGGPFYEILVSFASAGGGPDVVITDPTDASVVLEADLVAGLFNGSPTTGLQAQVIFDAGTMTAVFDSSNSVGFFAVDPGSAYASLFGTSYVGLNLGTLSDFSPSLSSLAVGAFLSGSLGSFTAEANAQIFRTAAGEFVPEPSLALLLAAGAGLFGVLRRRG